MIEGTVVAVPALGVGAAYLLLASRAGHTPATISVGLAAITHIALVVALTLFPMPVEPDAIEAGRLQADASNNIVPGASIVGGIARGGGSDVLQQAIGNLLALAPIGIYGPILWRAVRTWWAVLLVGIGASLGIEITQLLISTVVGFTYRVADIDDVFINAAGVVATYGVHRLLGAPR